MSSNQDLSYLHRRTSDGRFPGNQQELYPDSLEGI
jgi:hypothetical protein